MILVVDNYDSFTFNLVHLIRTGGHEVEVVRHDADSAEHLLERRPGALILSPGPGHPRSTGVCPELVRLAAGTLPILGVCLGHQVIAEVFGGRIVRTGTIVHGKTSRIRHDSRGMFAGLPESFEAMRYHSLAVDRASLPGELEVTAWVEDDPGLVMGLRHREYALEGVQFHPESFMTEHGPAMVKGFLGREIGEPW